ncbi:hypothetical protein ABZ917_23805 [Nonomuraea wenchangensis]
MTSCSPSRWPVLMGSVAPKVTPLVDSLTRWETPARTAAAARLRFWTGPSGP